MPTEIAEVTRGGIRESLHHGVVAVASLDGALVASAGDTGTVAFFRSSAKPFQAVPLVESGAADRFGFTAADLALCCASHAGSREHQRQVAGMLAKLGLEPGDLQCGVVLPGDGAESARVETGLVPASPLQCDCSGKHSGMLAVCLQRGYPLDGYLESVHPLQVAVLAIMARVMGVPRQEITVGTDGCSLPTFSGTIASFARSYAVLARAFADATDSDVPHAAALHRLGKAMVAHPENVSGHGHLVTDLMLVGDGRIVAKSGAEGLLCFALPESGLGVTIRILDGSFRAHAVVAAQVLRDLDAVPGRIVDALIERHDPRLFNHNRRHVGDIRACFSLQTA